MIARAARFIIGGGVIVYPTETVYGLGANALDEQAAIRVFQIKKRPLDRPIFLAVSNFDMLEKVAEVSRQDMELLRQILPGPVSVLVRKRRIVPDILTACSPLVGIRYPDHETALRIIDLAGPITSTSANRTGSNPPTSADAVSPEIRERVDDVVDGGKCPYGQPSTLLDLEKREIIRPGAGLDGAMRAIG